MHIEDLRNICAGLPAVTEDIKWGNNLCFCIGEKMFLVFGLGSEPITASFKVPDEEFERISCQEGFGPAPYLARYKWVMIDDLSRMSKTEWTQHIRQSYQIVFDKLPTKMGNRLSAKQE